MKLKRFNEAAAAYRESGKLEQRRAEMKAAEQNKNAYAGEAVGETVEKGKLTVDSEADVAKTLKTAENAELTSINGENMSVSGGKSVRFSIDNGKVVVDTDQNIFEGADRKDYGKIARNYMREHFRGKTVEDAEFTKVSEREYTSSRATQSLYKKNDGIYDTKMKASTELDNMLRVARKIGHEDAKHAHDFNQKGYDRYEVEFSLNGNEFSGELLVAIDENDRHTFYDIVKIKRSDSPVSAGLAERGTNASSSGTDSATNSITENAGKVNTSKKNSQENAENSADFGKNAASAESSSEKTESNAESSSEKSSKEKIAELKERIDKKKIDAYCRENIEEYASMSAANQSMIRQVVREGRVYGLDDADILSYARVAARSGLNIVYDENLDAKGIAGAYDPENNRIVVNPKAEKRQELILIHELDHTIRAYLGDDGKIHYLTYKGAEQRLSKETRDFVRGKEYSEQKIDVSREELFAGEASAYYTEAILGPKVTIDMLLGKEPTLAKKILNFFTGAARAYSKDAKLSKEARAHYRRFKKMFDDFAKWNQGRNAETAGEAVDNGDATRYNKDDLYITTDDFIKDVSIRDRSSFSRSLANKTTGMKEGETRRLRITAPQYTYLFKATGYMVGEMLDLVSNNDDRAIKAFWKEAKNELYKDTEATDIWTDSVPSGRGGSVDNLQNAGDRRGTARDDKLASRAPSSDGAGSDERVWKDNRSPEEREAELIRKAQEALGIEEKSKRYSKDITAKLFEVDEKELSKRTFSYKELVAKGDLTGYVIDKNVQVPLNSDGSINGKQIVADVRKKCKTLEDNRISKQYYLPALDIGRNVEIAGRSITHGFFDSTRKNKKPSPRDLLNAKVSIMLPEIIANSIEVNRSVRSGNVDIPYSRVMMGTIGVEDSAGNIEYYAVRSVVEERANGIPSFVEAKILGKLHAMNAKKIDSPNLWGAKNSVARRHGDVYTYSIAQFLQDVKGVFDDTFSVDVYNNLGVTRKNNDFSKNLRYSKDITPKLSDDASVGLRMEDENGNLVPLRLEGFTDERGRLIQEKSDDASKGATKRLRKSDRLSPKTFERLKKDGGRGKGGGLFLTNKKELSKKLLFWCR